MRDRKLNQFFDRQLREYQQLLEAGKKISALSTTNGNTQVDNTVNATEYLEGYSPEIYLQALKESDVNPISVKLSKTQMTLIILLLGLIATNATTTETEKSKCFYENQTFFQPICDFARVDFLGYQASDVTGKVIDKELKPYGSRIGKIAIIHEQKYMLKAISTDGEIFSNQGLHLAFNSKFIRSNLGLRSSPEVHIFHSKNEKFLHNENGKLVEKTSDFFTGTDWIEDFTPLHTYLVEKLKLNIPNGTAEGYMIDKLGDEGFAKFLVVLTWMDDIANNLLNCGFNSKNELIIIDADLSYQLTKPQHAKIEARFYRGALETFQNYILNKKLYNMKLSLKNIEDMKKIYESMKLKSIPKVHASINLSNETYQKIVDSYIELCNKVIVQLKTSTYKNMPANISHSDVGNFLISQLIGLSLEADMGFKKSRNGF